jgi:hypothetical protein
VKGKPKPGSGPFAETAQLGGPAVKLSVNVSSSIGERLRKLAFDERISESSIVEIALQVLFEGSPESDIGPFLRDRGATLRRGAGR